MTKPKPKKGTREYVESKMDVYPQATPVTVRAIQFNEKKFADYEPMIHRAPYPGRYPGGHAPVGEVQNAEFVFQGTDDITWPVENGDWVVMVDVQVFPSYFIPVRGHSFVMKDDDFKRAFKVPKKEKPAEE